MDSIVTNEAAIFEPNGPDTYPRFRIVRVEWLSSGRRDLKHYRVQEFSAYGAASVDNELETWGAVTKHLDGRFGGAFSKQFPGAQQVDLKKLSF